MIVILCTLLALVSAGPATESYKDQFCTDPRTMQKHQAYTEWADAYSCTRHRCQPGGRNLAIYTVGCKRVEAPESAIECEEVVEDTNMQFPYCCTRLRCLVVVRGEVWTRVLGQPWETLPAAPWSHMYKMKKPPPGDSTFLPKMPNEGPVYELSSDAEGDSRDKVLRANKKTATESPDCNEVAQRAVAAPDIVIALSTTNDAKDRKKNEVTPERVHNRDHGVPEVNFSHKRQRKPQNPYFEEEVPSEHRNEIENEEPTATEKPAEFSSDEKVYLNAYGVTQKPFKPQHQQVAWTEIPPNQWNDVGEAHSDAEAARETNHQPDFADESPSGSEKPPNLQALVDAIGSRMRDIENVVQRMSEKVHQAKPGEPAYASAEKRSMSDTEQPSAPVPAPPTPHKHHKGDKEHSKDRTKRPNTDDHYKRFSVRNRGSKYLHATDSTTEPPLFVEDTNMNGYFSDASNSMIRRANSPKLRRTGTNSTSRERNIPEVLEEHEPETSHFQPCNHTHHPRHRTEHLIEPAATYMAPVENRRKSTHILNSEGSEESEKKHKKRSHKRKKGKGKSHRKHRKEDKKKHQSRGNSAELDRNVVSLEDSSAIISK